MVRKLALLGSLIGSLAWGGAGLAAAPAAGERDVQGLALAIGRAAAAAEASAPADGTQPAVEIAVQEVIVGAAQPPMVVRNALQRVIAVCTRPADADRGGLACPGAPASFAALRNVLGVVVTMIEDGTAAVDEPVAFSTLPLPIPGGGGADYRRVP
ncbi:MAG: hypothetical protein ACK41C_09205 [Phenylobacterium sp.]|uniref:hypothetical protein n=1 Tax=Phenylobacterium sp. TaxID=1871053 RepID=UPI00391AC6E0